MPKIYVDGVIREMTQEELAQVERSEAEYWSSMSYGEAVNARIRERYSLSQELGIMRQSAEKPEEFAEYYDYCEECKAYIKAKIAKYGGVV